MLTEIIRLELLEKTFALPKHGNTVLDSMIQKREKLGFFVLSRPGF